jgi:hypothetical protein
MHLNGNNPEQYINQLPDDRKEAIGKLKKPIQDNFSEGFIENLSYGMIGYIVPHTLYPNSYHFVPKVPLPVMNIASQKN